MAVFAAIAFATFFLENDHFVTFFEVLEYLANYFGAFDNGSTNFNCFVVGLSEEYTVKFYSVAFFGCFAEIVNVQELSGLSLELLSLNFYDCVHLLYWFTVNSGGRSGIPGAFTSPLRHKSDAKLILLRLIYKNFYEKISAVCSDVSGQTAGKIACCVII